jgi:hypothetical protein
MKPAQPDFSSASFKTSTRTQGNGTCVEVAAVAGFVAVRDTKYRAGGYLSLPDTAFTNLLATIRPV